MATEILGHAHKPSEEWITEDTWEEIELRKECKKRLLQENNQEKKQDLQDEYRKRDKRVKSKAKRDKKILWTKWQNVPKKQHNMET